MALTISIEGKGVIANADNTTTDSAGGSWGRTGSGGVAWGTTTDTYYYGTTAISMALSGAGKNSWIYHDIGAGNELDFTPSTGSEAGQHIYVWIHCPTIGLSETLANEGVCIRVGSGTSAYRSFVIAGNNGSNGWTGGWKCFVIDPTKTGSISDTGSPSLASIRYIGLRGATTATAKGDNFFISQIAVGSGLRITGTSTTGWSEAVTYCTDLPNRAWGMLQEREGVYYQYGTINIGDATSQAANVSFTDSGRIIQAGISEYWSGTGTTFVTSADIDYMGINIEDHSSYTTTFTDGVIVGSDNGRSGSNIIGNSNHDYFLDLYGGTNAGSVTALYGTRLKDLTGVINSGNDGDHKFLGVAFVGCSQFDPVGAPVIRNCTFAETQDTVASLLWNDSIDIQSCSFIANTTGAAVEHADWNGTASGSVTTPDATGTTLTDSGASFLTTAAINDIVYNETDLSYGRITSVDSNSQVTHTTLTGGTDNDWDSSDAYSIATPYSYTDLLFSGNTYDVDNTTSPSNVVAISKAGTSNPSTFPSGDFVAIQGSVTVKVTVKDTTGTVIQNVRTGIYLTSDRSEILNTLTNASGVAETTYAGSTPAEVEVRCRKGSSGATKYINYSSIQNIQSGTGLTLDVTLREDPNNNATT